MIDDIQRAVEDELRLERGVLSSSTHGGNGRREEPIMKGRWVALMLCREFLPTVSASYLSRHFYREHSTALYVLKTFAKRGGYEWDQYKRCRPIVEKIVAANEKLRDPYVMSREEKAVALRDAATRHLKERLDRANAKIARLAAANERMSAELALLKQGEMYESLTREIAALRQANLVLRSTSITATVANEMAVLKRENANLRAQLERRKRT